MKTSSSSPGQTGWSEWWRYGHDQRKDDMLESGDEAWAAQCKARAQSELVGRSARIKAAITQMEMICPPVRIEE